LIKKISTFALIAVNQQIIGHISKNINSQSGVCFASWADLTSRLYQFHVLGEGQLEIARKTLLAEHLHRTNLRRTAEDALFLALQAGENAGTVEGVAAPQLKRGAAVQAHAATLADLRKHQLRVAPFGVFVGNGGLQERSP
jgi:hypothetical protein